MKTRPLFKFMLAGLLGLTASAASAQCVANFSVINTPDCHVRHFQNNTVGSFPKYVWNFGMNGATFSDNSGLDNYFNGNGTYIVSLSVYTSTASATPCDTYTQAVTIGCPSASTCHAAFTATATPSGCTVDYTNVSPHYGGTLYQWHFADGTSSGLQTTPTTISHTFPNPNALTQLALYTSTNTTTPYCVLTQTITANCSTVTPCQATSSITVFADTANAGNYFCYNQSTGNGTLSYLWDFGDGNTSTQQYPFHQYAVPGSYVICLTTTSTSGTVTCSDTDCDSSSVQRMASGFVMNSVNVIPQMTTGIKNMHSDVAFSAYPNPVEDVLNIEIGTTASREVYHVVLIDALGRQVINKDINGNHASVNTGTLPKGYYTLSLVNASGEIIKTIKLMK